MKFLFVLAIAVVFVLVYFPGISLFLSTPMLPGNHELQDPTVSFLSYDPGYRLFQYELFNNKNIWWSNLRGMGLPLLGNEIQTAPLFPLVLLLCWVPFEYFWNAFVVVKMILLGMGTLLICKDIIKFRWVTSIFFSILFVNNLYVIRWMNHPWHNGLSAGIWYIYFMGLSVVIFRRQLSLKQIFLIFGIALAAYSMVTCGFPESSIMSAILTVLVLGPYFLWKAYQKKIAYKNWSIGIAAGHFIGFTLASPQLLSLYEFLSLREGVRLRSDLGIRQYEWSDLLPFSLERIIPVSDKISFVFRDNAIFFGVIPLFFFIIGVSYFVFKRKEITIWAVSAVFCFLFIFIKLFPVWPSFNQFIGTLPILRECYFYVYFFSIFVFFFSYFSAIGFEKQILSSAQFNKNGTSGYLLVVVCFFIVLCLLNMAVIHLKDQSLPAFDLNSNRKVIVWIIGFLTVFILTIAQIRIFKKSNSNFTPNTVGIIIICLFVFESKTMLNLNFPERTIFNANLRLRTERLNNILEKNDLPVHEVRIIDISGKYTSGGIATIDDGAPPILQERLARFRRAIFNVGADGYLPIKENEFDHSWAMASVNLIYKDAFYGSYDNIVDWRTLVKKNGGRAVVDDIYFQKKRQIKHQLRFLGHKEDYISLSGWAFDNIEKSAEKTKVYVILIKKDIEVTVPTIKTVRSDVAAHINNAKYFRCGFMARLHAGILMPGKYKIALRIIRGDQASYFEHILGYELNVITAPSESPYSRLKYLDNFENKYLYFDPNALSRAYLPVECNVANNIDRANELISRADFNPGAVVIENLTDNEKMFCETFHGSMRPIRILKDKGKLIDLEPIQGPGIVVLNDNYYPGWHAYDRLSGDRLPIRPANLTFRAVILDQEKTYQIHFKYKPGWLEICYFLVGMGIISILVLLIVAYRINMNTRRSAILSLSDHQKLT